MSEQSEHTQPAGIGELATRYGLLRVPQAGDDVIGRFLASYGEWAWLEAAFIASIIPDGARVLDAGAFIGTFGLGVARCGAPSFVGFVEANPAVTPILRNNVAANATCPSVVVNAMVAGPEARSGSAHSLPGNLGGTSFAENANADDMSTDNAAGAIAATTLAVLRADHGPFDLIKLDIEGQELAALRGDAAFLATGQTALWIEANEAPATLTVAGLLLSWRLPLYYFAFPSFNPLNFNGARQPIFPFAFEAGLLAAPGTPPVLHAELRDAGCILRQVTNVEALKDALWRTPRWGLAGWDDAGNTAELAALAGRSIVGESYTGFLTPGAAENRVSLWQRLDEERTALQAARHRADLVESREAASLTELRIKTEAAAALQGDLSETRERLAQAEAERVLLAQQLAEARSLANARLNELQINSGAAATLRDDLTTATQRLAGAEAECMRLRQQLAEASGLAAARLDELKTVRQHQADITAVCARLEAQLSGLSHTGEKALEQLTTLSITVTKIDRNLLLRAGRVLNYFINPRSTLLGVLRKLRPEAAPVAPEPAASSDPARQAAMPRFFDPLYYLEMNPDVAQAEIDPLDHFLSHGWREGRSPSPALPAGDCPGTDSNATEAGIDPLSATLPAPPPDAARTCPVEPEPAAPEVGGDAAQRDAVRPYFDRLYYVRTNPDVALAEIDPLDHFLSRGWRERRSPSPAFDVRYYLDTYLDVAAAGLNPVLHYVWAGKAEGRLPVRPLSNWRHALDSVLPPRARIAEWAGAADHTAPLSRATLLAVLAADRTADMVVSISHDDYAINCGGIQNVISDEQRTLAISGSGYLHLSPAAPLPMLAEPQPAADYRLRLRLNGEAVGIARCDDLAAALTALRGHGTTLAFVFHHLSGHVPELLATLPEPVDQPTIVWAHDFFTLCPNFSMMRNDVSFCGAPPVASGACSVCVYGNDRQRHAGRMKQFFAALLPTVLTPSAFARDVWRRGDLPHALTAVEPPARLTPDAELVAETSSGKLRIAHLGVAIFGKGWSVFERLAILHANDDRYEFIHLGLGSAPSSFYACDPVQVDRTRRDAMIEAVVRNRIDVAINWSLFAETFSFTVHEALAGGAFVVTRRGAGNIWPAVQANAPGQGCAIENEDTLFQLFASGAIRALVAGATRRRFRLTPGGNTTKFLMCHGTPAPVAEEVCP